MVERRQGVAELIASGGHAQGLEGKAGEGPRHEHRRKAAHEAPGATARDGQDHPGQHGRDGEEHEGGLEAPGRGERQQRGGAPQQRLLRAARAHGPGLQNEEGERQAAAECVAVDEGRKPVHGQAGGDEHHEHAPRTRAGANGLAQLQQAPDTQAGRERREQLEHHVRVAAKGQAQTIHEPEERGLEGIAREVEARVVEERLVRTGEGRLHAAALDGLADEVAHHPGVAPVGVLGPQAHDEGELEEEGAANEGAGGRPTLQRAAEPPGQGAQAKDGHAARHAGEQHLLGANPGVERHGLREVAVVCALHEPDGREDNHGQHHAGGDGAEHEAEPRQGRPGAGPSLPRAEAAHGFSRRRHWSDPESADELVVAAR